MGLQRTGLAEQSTNSLPPWMAGYTDARVFDGAALSSEAVRADSEALPPVHALHTGSEAVIKIKHAHLDTLAGFFV